MNKEELKQFNEDIEQKEREIYEMELSHNVLKGYLEIAIADFTQNLESKYADSKDKMLSTIEKRYALAIKHLPIETQKKDLEKMKSEIEFDKIGLRKRLREFEIEMKFGD